jgi:hypothetical protein
MEMAIDSSLHLLSQTTKQTVEFFSSSKSGMLTTSAAQKCANPKIPYASICKNINCLLGRERPEKSLWSIYSERKF